VKKAINGAIIGLVLVVAGCGSSNDEASIDPMATTDTVASAESTEPAIQSDLEITQEWNGNSVTLSLFDSKGNNCAIDVRTVGSECYGFYIGWEANFDDADRVVDYSKTETTTISELEVGDSGNFLLMYQDPNDSNSPVYRVNEFPFAYNG